MPRTAPAPLTAAAVLSLPLLLVAGGCLALWGTEAAVAAHFALWRAEHQTATRLLTYYTDFGNLAFYLVYAGILVQALRQRSKDRLCLVLAYLGAQLLVSLLAARVLKIGIGRPRPLVGGSLLPFTLEPSQHSLPSGHSTEMTLQTLPLAMRAQSLLLPLLLGLALGLMAFSRIALGWHHPTDVLAGWALGLLGGLLVQRFAQALMHNPRLSQKLRQKLGWNA